MQLTWPALVTLGLLDLVLHAPVDHAALRALEPGGQWRTLRPVVVQRAALSGPPLAEQTYRRALAIRENALGPAHPDVARILDNLAALYTVWQRYDQAEALYRRALAIEEAALGPAHPDLAATLTNLAGLYVAGRRYRDAESLYVRALTIRETALGPIHRDVAVSLHNLAGVYQMQGDSARAEALYRQALTIYERTEGPDHPELTSTLENLAGFYERRGEYDRAERLYRRALAITDAPRPLTPRPSQRPWTGWPACSGRPAGTPRRGESRPAAARSNIRDRDGTRRRRPPGTLQR